MSAKAVQAAGGGAENGSPDFLDEKAERTVAESVAVGSRVGAPVVASVDSVSLKDTLTYSLRAFATGDEGSTGLTVTGERRRRPGCIRHRQGVGTDHHGG